MVTSHGMKALLPFILMLAVPLIAYFGQAAERTPEGALAFSYDASEFTQERELLRPYLPASFGEDESLRLGIALTDINDDGVQDIVLYANRGKWCQRWGCNLYVFQRSKDKPQVLTRVLGPLMTRASEVRILPDKIGGYHDIEFRFPSKSYTVWTMQNDSYTLEASRRCQQQCTPKGCVTVCRD